MAGQPPDGYCRRHERSAPRRDRDRRFGHRHHRQHPSDPSQAPVSELEGITCVFAMKNESTNPGGSAKDRPALEMILAAERDGLLQPGGTIVEPTSGNTGVGLAIVAAQRGYKCVFVMTDKVAPEKVSLLQGLRRRGRRVPGRRRARAIRTSYYSVAERLTHELGAFRPNQYAQPAQPRGPRDDHRARRSGARPPGASRTSSPAPARAARSPASPATSSR